MLEEDTGLLNIVSYFHNPKGKKNDFVILFWLPKCKVYWQCWQWDEVNHVSVTSFKLVVYCYDADRCRIAEQTSHRNKKSQTNFRYNTNPQLHKIMNNIFKMLILSPLYFSRQIIKWKSWNRAVWMSWKLTLSLKLNDWQHVWILQLKVREKKDNPHSWGVTN